MKRPLLLAALCWALVALGPGTRNGLMRAREAAFSLVNEQSFDAARDAFEREAQRRFPADRRVHLDVLLSAVNNSSNATDRKVKAKIEAAAQKIGDDPVAITLLLSFRLRELKPPLSEGPLSTSGGRGAPAPKKQPRAVSPRADWDAFMALARRGQKLEPQNTYFDWWILYALFATRRDDEARAVLKLAARKSDYDDHSRDMILNRLAVVRLVRGSPLTPIESYEAWANVPLAYTSKWRQTTRIAMESAIADRSAGRHARALDTALETLQLGRLMRRKSYSLLSTLTASAIEQATLKSFLSPASVITRRMRASVGMRIRVPSLRQDSFYYYAQNHGRTDITRFIDRESPELSKWRKLGPVLTANEDWTGNSTAQILTITAAARLRSLILRGLPSILLSGALFTLLARRFRDNSSAPVGGFWRGAIAGMISLILLLALDAIIIYGQTDSGDELMFAYLDSGLISDTPSWATLGPALATILLALNAAIGWQTRQIAPPIALKTRFQTTFDAPEDGLMRFDFGWWLGLVAKSTGWILLFGLFITTSFNFAEGGFAHSNPALYGSALMGFTALFCLTLNYVAWSRKPRRRATLRLGWRLISQSLLGFFVASSVIYALVAFAMWPLAFRFDRNFQSAMQRGGVQIARAKLGL